ncbi:MAG: acylphosphatase [Thermoplasmata archaeon]
MERAHVIFEGHVQGIYFRAFVKERADKIGINGWVRNLSNGNVEAVFEGEKTKIDELIEICRTMHPLANVTKVKIDWETPEGFSGFKILH